MEKQVFLTLFGGLQLQERLLKKHFCFKIITDSEKCTGKSHRAFPSPTGPKANTLHEYSTMVKANSSFRFLCLCMFCSIRASCTCSSTALRDGAETEQRSHSIHSTIRSFPGATGARTQGLTCGVSFFFFFFLVSYYLVPIADYVCNYLYQSST